MGLSIEQTLGQETSGWTDIDWATRERIVRRLQERIFRATRRGQLREIRNLQKLLTRSESLKLLAIRRVTQENQGKTTPGIDGALYLTPQARWKWSQEEDFDLGNHQPRPAKRVFIPKSSGGKRPLGIPTMKDRVMQAIVKEALEPEWEARFEPNSYGFRPGRRCQDAVEQIRYCIKRKVGGTGSPVVLDGDIAGCFDNIAHEPLLSRIPVFRDIVRRWLKAGVIVLGHYEPTVAGTPQGGVISPLLANIALDGMERLFGIEDATGKYLRPSLRPGNRGISLVRYADDFLVFARNPWEVEWYILPKLRKFLASRGLALSAAKTRVTTRAAGFNFLGFSFRQKWTKHSKILLVMPQKEKVQRLLESAKAILSSNKQATIEHVVVQLNLLIRGWANFYRFCHASTTFKHVDYRVFQMVWQWCTRRHPNKGRRWVKGRYFRSVGNRHWVFGTKNCHLTSAGALHVAKYVKVKGTNTPFDPALHEYWEERVRHALRHRCTSTLKRVVLAEQDYRCAACHLSLHEGDPIHFHHVVPRKDGGPTCKGNLQAVHQRCHAPQARRQQYKSDRLPRS